MLLSPEGDPAGTTPPAAPASPASPAATTIVDLAAKVRTDDGEVSLGELVAAAREAKSLRAFRDSVANYQASSSDPDKLMTNSVSMLKGLGYDETEATRLAQEHVETVFGPSDPPTRGTRGGEKVPDWAQDLTAKIQEMEERNRHLEQMAMETTAEQLAQELQDQVRRGIETDETGRTMVEAFTRLNGEQAGKALQEQIRRQAQLNLRDRRAMSGKFDRRWIAEEAAKAIKQVSGAFSSVIGDVNRLGRSSETESERDYLIQKTQPVKAPPASRTVSESEVDKWMNDALFRAANEDGTPRATRI